MPTELFKIGDGPWQTIFQGDYHAHETIALLNQNSVVLTIIFEKDEENVTGALVELFKVFHAIGSIEAFVEAIPREAKAIFKHKQGETQKFLMISSGSSYVKYREELFQLEINLLMKRIENLSNLLSEVSKAFELELRELNESPAEVQDGFFAETFLPQIIIPKSERREEREEETKEEIPISFAKEVVLGLNQKGLLMREPINYFQKTLITGPDEGKRKHLLHILSEGALLSDITTILFDWNNEFDGLSEPTRKLEELKKANLETEPIGFPIKHFLIGEEIKLDLRYLDPKALLQRFGVKENEATKIIEEYWSISNANSLKELIEYMKKLQIKEAAEFHKQRAVRILQLIEQAYPKMIEGKNNYEAITKNWIKAIGRAVLIQLKKTDERLALLIINNLLKGITDFLKQKGKTANMRIMIILPKARKAIPLNPEFQLSKEITKSLIDMTQFGGGYIMEEEKEIDLDKEITMQTETFLSIIMGNDAAIKFKNKQQYRISLRPALSTCTETENAQSLPQHS